MDKLNKYLLTDKQANLWKFVATYKRYKAKELTGYEYFKFMDNMKYLKAENKPLDELIMDDHFLSFFVHYWENGRQKW